MDAEADVNPMCNEASLEMLIHMFCVEKNISVQNERLLFDIVGTKYRAVLLVPAV
jgi:mRNA-degrading endonuclease HigB of HigAB toxin-antitoxin module